MQNISAVLQEMKLPFIKGYAPTGNVGSNVKPFIIAAIERHSAEMPFAPATDLQLYEARAEILMHGPCRPYPACGHAPRNPARSNQSSSNHEACTWCTMEFFARN